MKPYIGQMVEYRYKPEKSDPPLPAIVSVVHSPAGDGKDWVSLHLFSEVPRFIPMVEFAHHCREAQPPEAVTPLPTNPWFGG